MSDKPLIPVSPEDLPGADRRGSSRPLIEFQPVELRARHDGWTAEKQIAFIEALAETACVEDACKRVGMTPQSAYRLRRRECGSNFLRAWDDALDHALHRLEQAALSRAVNGVPRPIFYKGEQVGEWREYDERLTMFLLRNRRPARFGKWIDRTLALDALSAEDEAIRLDEGLETIEQHAEFFEPNDGEDDPDSPARVEE